MSDNNEELDYLFKLLEHQGAVASTIKDGRLLFFKREFLEKLLAAHPDKEKFSIFLKRPDFKN